MPIRETRKRMKGNTKQAVGIILAILLMTIIFYAAWAIWLADL